MQINCKDILSKLTRQPWSPWRQPPCWGWWRWPWQVPSLPVGQAVTGTSLPVGPDLLNGGLLVGAGGIELHSYKLACRPRSPLWRPPCWGWWKRTSQLQAYLSAMISVAEASLLGLVRWLALVQAYRSAPISLAASSLLGISYGTGTFFKFRFFRCSFFIRSFFLSLYVHFL